MLFLLEKLTQEKSNHCLLRLLDLIRFLKDLLGNLYISLVMFLDMDMDWD